MRCRRPSNLSSNIPLSSVLPTSRTTHVSRSAHAPTTDSHQANRRISGDRREGSLKSIIDKWLEELLFFKQHSWSLGATRFLVSDAYFARAAKYLLYKHSYPGRARAENYSPSPSLRSFPFPSSSFFRWFWNALFLFCLTLCTNWISWETCTIDSTKAFLWQDVGKKSKQNIIRKVLDLVASSSM